MYKGNTVTWTGTDKTVTHQVPRLFLVVEPKHKFHAYCKQAEQSTEEDCVENDYSS